MKTVIIVIKTILGLIMIPIVNGLLCVMFGFVVGTYPNNPHLSYWPAFLFGWKFAIVPTIVSVAFVFLINEILKMIIKRNEKS